MFEISVLSPFFHFDGRTNRQELMCCLLLLCVLFLEGCGTLWIATSPGDCSVIQAKCRRSMHTDLYTDHPTA